MANSKQSDTVVLQELLKEDRNRQRRYLHNDELHKLYFSLNILRVIRANVRWEEGEHSLATGEPNHRASDRRPGRNLRQILRNKVVQHRVVTLPDRARPLCRVESLHSPRLLATAPSSKKRYNK